MILPRTSSVAPCSERARRNCVDSLASSRICGASPLVERVMWRSVFRAKDADDFHLRRVKFRCELSAQLARQIRHRVEGGDAFFVDPISNLFRAIGRGAAFF